MTLLFLLAASAFAAVDVQCEGQVGNDPPSFYTNDAAQLAYALNHFALNTSYSPLHGAFPTTPKHLDLRLELMVTPGLNCERRFYEDRQSTMDTNHTPVLPRFRVGFTSKKLGKLVLYGSAGFTPPLPLGGATAVVASGEAGFGIPVSDKTAISARVHYSHNRTTAHIFPPTDIQNDLIRDFYDGSTFGVDGVASFAVGKAEPYLAVGYVDVSTFAWRGEDSAVINNYDPYAGMALSLGSNFTTEHFVGAAEFYAVPGNLYTARVSGGVQF